MECTVVEELNVVELVDLAEAIEVNGIVYCLVYSKLSTVDCCRLLDFLDIFSACLS